MKHLKRLLSYKKETGFSLIEIMISIVITGFIGLGATISSLQVMTETSRNKNYTAASRNAMNAVFWISRDAQMAQTISGVFGFPETSDLSLSWMDWDNNSHNATYSVQNGQLLRIYDVDGNVTESVIAEFINVSPESTNCTSVNGTLVLTITSSVGEGSKVVDVTRVREMTARPRL
jgi:Tfp pilus assembly protein PilW